MKPKLTEAGFAGASRKLNCEVAAIKAVCDVEAPKGGFLDDDRVRILFERHKFHSFTGGIYSAQYPDISNHAPGGYGPEGAHQWLRFSKAFALDPKAAMKSCSWGKFQIMGFNFAAAGFAGLDAFVEAMKVSEDEQLSAFVRIVQSFALADELRQHDWAGFARGYNGVNYRINHYDVKLAAAYARHTNERPIENGVGSSVVADIEPIEIPDVTESDAATDDGTQASEPTSGMIASPNAKEVKIATMSPTIKAVSLGTIGTAVIGALQQAWESSQSGVVSGVQYALAHLPMVLLILGLAALGVFLYNQAAKRAAARTAQIVEIAANTEKHDVVIT